LAGREGFANGNEAVPHTPVKRREKDLDESCVGGKCHLFRKEGARSTPETANVWVEQRADGYYPETMAPLRNAQRFRYTKETVREIFFRAKHAVQVGGGVTSGVKFKSENETKQSGP